MTDQEHGPLGQSSTYPDQYDPSQLHAIPRALGRSAIGIAGALPFHGEDIWNAFELSWLNSKGKPLVALMEMRVPASSPNIVESKSLKLYLGSFNQWVVDSVDSLRDIIARDVGATVGAPVDVTLTPMSHHGGFALATLPGRCIDDLDIHASVYEVDATLLSVGEETVRDIVHSHVLRSCCPVTGQPDWASVLIQYSGRKITDESLLKYLISFRNNQEFHEQCVERIFMDICSQCTPQNLSVYARFTRRGGIDINPFRSSEPLVQANLRLVRQ